MCCNEPNINIFKLLLKQKDIKKDIKNNKNETCLDILKRFKQILSKQKDNIKGNQMIKDMLELV